MLVFEVLPKAIHAARDGALVSALERHREETRMHVQRVERASRALAAEPSSKRSAALAALAEHADGLAAKVVEPRLRDVALAASAARIEHLELALYETIEPLLTSLGAGEAARLLDESRGDEERALADATATAERLAADGS